MTSVIELSWKHNGDGWLNEVQLTYEDAFYVPHINNGDVNGAPYTWRDGSQDRASWRWTAPTRALARTRARRAGQSPTIITFTDLAWGAGDHTVKAGIKYKDVDLTAADSIPGNPVFYYDVTAAGTAAIPWKAVFALPLAGLRLRGHYQRQATRRVPPGRLDRQRPPDTQPRHPLGRRGEPVVSRFRDAAVPDRFVQHGDRSGHRRASPRPVRWPSADPNVGTRHQRLHQHRQQPQREQDDSFQPRFGFSYDFGGDQAHVLFGGAGRAYDRTLYDYLQLEQTKFALATTQVLFNTTRSSLHRRRRPRVSTCDPAYFNDPNALPALLNGRRAKSNLINNDLKVPYSDQYSLGMRNRLGDWNTSASVAHVVSKDGFVFTMGNRYPDGDFWENRGQPWGNSPPGLAGVLLVGDNGIETKSTQVLLSAEKPFTDESRWGARICLHIHGCGGQSRHQRTLSHSTRSRSRSTRSRVSNAAAEHRVVATGSYSGALGIHVRGQAHLVDADSAATSISCYAGARSLPERRALHRVRVRAGRRRDTRRSTCRSRRDFEIGDIGSMYLRVDVLNVTNEHNLVDFIDASGAERTRHRRAIQSRRQDHRRAADGSHELRREVLMPERFAVSPGVRCDNPIREGRRLTSIVIVGGGTAGWMAAAALAHAAQGQRLHDHAHRIRRHRHGRRR